MDLNQVLKGLDDLFENHQLDKVEPYLDEQLNQAVAENDFGAAVSILNEMLGFARETSQYDKCEKYAEQALNLMENSPYKGTLSHATTLLNVATALRAAGKLEQSGERYSQVEAIYKIQLSDDDYQYASLYNNKGLLFEEMQEYEKAADSFRRAISIVSAYEGNEYYQAVSYANLANAEVVLAQYQQAAEHAAKAIDIFDELNVADSHKGAALAAFGEVYLAKGDREKAIDCYEQAKTCIYQHIGKNVSYYRVEERLKELKAQEQDNEEPKSENSKGIKSEEAKEIKGEKVKKSESEKSKVPEGEEKEEKITGAQLCREYYEKYGAQMLEQQFPDYVSKIAVGHVGEGSDCFGFDDVVSQDHDFGPGFSMWVSKSTFDEIGEKLQKAYMELPGEYKGFSRVTSKSGSERFGVCVVEDFYKRVLAGEIPKQEQDYLSLEDCYLAAAVNGQVYRDEEGLFTAIREKLRQGYPEGVKLLKLAQKVALFGQNGQYNYERCAKRGEWTAALLAKSEALRLSMQIVYLLSGCYAPHDKWLHRGIQQVSSPMYDLTEKLTQCDLKDIEKNVRLLEEIALLILEMLKNQFYVTSQGDFLPDLAVEIARRGQLSMMPEKELIEAVVSLEKEHLEKECIEKEHTEKMDSERFYSLWTKNLLVQYCYDMENQQMYALKGIQIPEQRRKIEDAILEIEKNESERNAGYTDFLENRIHEFSDAMLVQYGRYAASKQG